MNVKIMDKVDCDWKPGKHERAFVIHDDQFVRLCCLYGKIHDRTGRAVAVSKIVRGMIGAALGSGVDLTACRTEADVASRLTAAIKRGAVARA